jgi:hypothetical protein
MRSDRSEIVVDVGTGTPEYCIEATKAGCRSLARHRETHQT